MKNYLERNPEVKIILKITTALFFLFIVFLSVNYFYISLSMKQRLVKDSENILKKIASDIRPTENGSDPTLYFQDTTTPFDKPLYIISNDGFIIERMNPIAGFLDTGEFKFSSSFTKPQTITTSASSSWRVFSLPIAEDGKTLGTILTAYFDPDSYTLEIIDKNLTETAQKISSTIFFENNRINVSLLEPKNIHQSIYYSVIDVYNRVLAEDGGPPMYIDRSFFAGLLENRKPYEISNIKNKERFLISSKVLYKNDKTPFAVLVYGQPLNDLNQMLSHLKKSSLITGSAALAIIITLLMFIFGREIRILIMEKANNLVKESNSNIFVKPKKIFFDKNTGTIYLDKTILKIEYGSKQFDLCRALFSRPGKRWEYDELLEKNHLTEDEQSTRMFYDAALNINQKIQQLLGDKLIVYDNKTYRINPAYLKKIKS